MSSAALWEPGKSRAGSSRGARELAMRLAVTLFALGAVAALRWVPLPFIDLFVVREHGMTTSFAVGGLGVAPWMSGAVLVEFVVLFVPRWRVRRDAGPEAREPIRRAGLMTGFVLAGVQTMGIVLFISNLDDEFATVSIATNAFELLQQGVVIYAGACATLLAAAVVSSRGLGDGFALFFLFETGFSVWERLRIAEQPHQSETWVGLGVALVVSGAALTWLRAQRLPGPISGLAGMNWVFGLLGLRESLAALGVGEGSREETLAPVWLVVSGAAVLTTVAALLFTPPRAAQSALLRSGVAASAIAGRSAYAQAMVISVLGASVYTWFAWGHAATEVVVLVVPVAAYAVDVVGEAGFRWAFGPCFVVDELHRPYLLRERIASLPGGTPVFARALSFRSLLQFFGPYVPILLLVPEDEVTVQESQADDADAAPR